MCSPLPSPGGVGQPTVLNVDHYLLQLNSKLDTLVTSLETLKSKLEELDANLLEHKQDTSAELAQLQSSLTNTHSSHETHTQQVNTKLSLLTTGLSQQREETLAELAQLQTSLINTQSSLATHTQQVNTKLSLLTTSLSEHKQQTATELAQLHASLTNTQSPLTTHTQRVNTKLSLLTTSLSEHREETTTELAQLQTSVNNTQSSLKTISTTLNALTANTAQLSTDHQQMQTSISDVECVDREESIQLHQNLQNNLTHQLDAILNHASRILGPYTCGGTGGWRRVVYLDMTDPSTICPSGWQLTGYSKRTCGRVSTQRLACDSVTFPVSGGEYSRVCGRIKAYQHGLTDGFEAYHDGDVTTIDGAYVVGVSLTHGNPRKHIWTFAAGYSEKHPTRRDVCPCDASITIRVPPFVGDDYFCESGRNAGGIGGFYPDDPLWDGQNCTSSSTCCSFNTPPYFVKQLPTSTTDSIEARLCLLDSGEDSPVELIELYVQ